MFSIKQDTYKPRRGGGNTPPPSPRFVDGGDGGGLAPPNSNGGGGLAPPNPYGNNLGIDPKNNPYPQQNVNNWMITSFRPTAANNKPTHGATGGNNMMKSIAFVGEAHKYKEKLQQLKAQGQKYTDHDFPHRIESLWGFGETQQFSKSEWERLAWCSPDEIFKGGKYYVYDQSISPNDIQQGGLGDCYYLAAIAAVAEHRDRIKRVFLSREVNKIGCYCIALCINGVWEEIIMDDKFPSQPYSKSAAFNTSKSNEMWVMLLEKAWAKVHGGYLNINAGLTREALHDLTGAPAITYFNDEGSEEERWNIIYDGEKKNYIMCAGSDD